jgi:hypothetical protein
MQMEALSHVPAPPNHPPTPAATQAHADALQQAGSIAQAATPEDTSARDKGVADVHPWIAPAFSESAHEHMTADVAAAEALQKCFDYAAAEEFQERMTKHNQAEEQMLATMRGKLQALRDDKARTSVHSVSKLISSMQPIYSRIAKRNKILKSLQLSLKKAKQCQRTESDLRLASQNKMMGLGTVIPEEWVACTLTKNPLALVEGGAPAAGTLFYSNDTLGLIADSISHAEYLSRQGQVAWPEGSQASLFERNDVSRRDRRHSAACLPDASSPPAIPPAASSQMQSILREVAMEREKRQAAESGETVPGNGRRRQEVRKCRRQQEVRRAWVNRAPSTGSQSTAAEGDGASVAPAGRAEGRSRKQNPPRRRARPTVDCEPVVRLQLSSTPHVHFLRELAMQREERQKIIKKKQKTDKMTVKRPAEDKAEQPSAEKKRMPRKKEPSCRIPGASSSEFADAGGACDPADVARAFMRKDFGAGRDSLGALALDQFASAARLHALESNKVLLCPAHQAGARLTNCRRAALDSIARFLSLDFSFLYCVFLKKVLCVCAPLSRRFASLRTMKGAYLMFLLNSKEIAKRCVLFIMISCPPALANVSRDKRPPNLTNIASAVGVESGLNAPTMGHEPGQNIAKGQKARLTHSVERGKNIAKSLEVCLTHS